MIQAQQQAGLCCGRLSSEIHCSGYPIPFLQGIEVVWHSIFFGAKIYQSGAKSHRCETVPPLGSFVHLG